MKRTRILVADSLGIFRSGVRNLLARESDFEVVEAGTLDEVLSAAELESPDIALIDLELEVGGVVPIEVEQDAVGACVGIEQLGVNRLRIRSSGWNCVVHATFETTIIGGVAEEVLGEVVVK